MTIAIIIISAIILLYQTRKRPALFIYCLAWIGIVCVQAVYFTIRLNDENSCIHLVYSTLCRAETELAAKYLAVNNVLMILLIPALKKVRFRGAPILGCKLNNSNNRNLHWLRSEKIYIAGSIILFYILITGGTLNPLSAISTGSDATTRNLASATTLALLPRILVYRQLFITGTTTRTYNILLALMLLTSLLISRVTTVALISELYIVRNAAALSHSRKSLGRQEEYYKSPKSIPITLYFKRIISLALALLLGIGIFLYGTFRHEYSVTRHQGSEVPNAIEVLADIDKITKFGEITYFQSVSTFAGIVAASTTDASHAHTLVSSFIENSTIGVVKNLVPSAQLKDMFSDWFGMKINQQLLTILPSLFEFSVLLIGLNSIVILNAMSLFTLFYLEWLLRHYPRQQRYNEATFIPIVAVSLSVSMRGSPWGVASSTIATCLLGLFVFRLFPLYDKY